MFRSTGFFNNWYEFYQRYVLVFNLIIVISLVPFGWMYLQIDSGTFQTIFREQLIQWTGTIFLGSISGYFLYKSYFQTKAKIISIPKEWSVRKKLETYYRYQMNKFIRYELIALASLVGMLLFQAIFFAIFYLFILFMFSLDWPKYTKVVLHLQFSTKEQAELESSESLAP